MSDGRVLVARLLPPTDDRSLVSPPAPPAGFARGEVSAIGVFRGDEAVWTATFCRAELRTLGRTVARAAVLGTPAILDPRTEGDNGLLERCYRTVLDFALTGSGAAHVMVVELGDTQLDHVDILWRLALAMDGRLTIRECEDRVRVELYPPGRGGDLALLVAARPHAVIRAVAGRAAAVFGGRAIDKPGTPLAILTRDLTASATPVVPRVAVQFSELPEEEVRRRPRRFGMALASVDAPGHRRQFVGRADGQIVFRLALHASPPVLGLMRPALRSTLPQPVALLTEAYTEPQFRNRSIFAAGLHWCAGWARQQGIRTLMMLIRIDNKPSLRAATKGGFQRVGELTLPP